MKIVWTNFAIEKLWEIFNYYKEKADSVIAHKIKNSILNSVRHLENHPRSGQKEPVLESLNEGHRYVVHANYKIIYHIDDNLIIIDDVFDTRQDPSKLLDKKRKKE